MRRVALVVMAGVVAAAVALPSSARPLSAVPYKARGTLDFVGPTPTTPDRVVGTVDLQPVKARGDEVAIGPAPARGTATVVGPVQVTGPRPATCAGLVAKGSLKVTWSDGTSSSGTFTLTLVSRVVTILGRITGGLRKGSQLDMVGVAPGPPEADCDATFAGYALLGVPPSI